MMTHRARSLKAVLCILAAAIVFFLPSLSRSARAEEPVAITVPGITVTVKDGSTGDPAAGYIMRQMTGVGAPPTKGASGFSKLEGNDARLYTALKPLIAEVAAGERGSTVFEIPVTEIYEKIYYTFEELGAVDGDAAQAAFQDRIAFDIGKVNSALLVDCPYELYWYDKTSGIGSQGYSYSMTSTAVFFPENNTIPIYLYVSAEYSVSGSSGTFDMDTSWGTSVQAAASTARGIVTANAGLGDIAKLTAYKDAICGRVDYNFDALAAGTLYGNPWQLIWVFDNDPTTKVVCEGYSKAFQFLCDESAFSGSTSSIIVSGTMQGGTGAGGHMWNVVTLDNGRKYLADVTNSDAGSVGQDGGLFLDGYTNKEALSDGRVAYTYEIGSQSITYWYDSKIIDLYGPDDLSLPEIIDQGTLDGGIAWALDDNGLLTLEGTGEAAVASADAQPWYSYRSGITSVHVSEGITSLGDHLFHGLNALESVDLPSGLESIRAYTFDNCAALQAVDLPAGLTSIGNYAFDGCHALMSVVIPDTVTSLGKDVFSNCHALSSAVVGSGVTDLPEGAFNNCESLADVTFRGELMSIGPWAFSNGDSNGGQIWAMSSFTVPDTVMSIGAYAFNLQTGLTEMVLPASVEEIGAYAFKSCRGLTSVTVLDRDAEFGEGAFDQCTGMTLRGYACSTAADYAAANDITYQAIPGGDHVMTAHPKLEATCTEEGTEAYWECTVCGKLFSDENGTTQIDEPVAIAAGHTLTAHAKKEVTCTEDGMEAYWECTVCGCIFADGDGLAELDALPVIYTDGHDLTENPKVEATCTENGMEAYWECGVCGKLFADADALMEIDAPVTIPGGHHLTAHEKQDANCTTDGMEAYWECDVCGKLFSDADAFTEIDEPVTIPGGHHLTAHEKQDATCTENGMEAYWECTVCGCIFADGEGLTELDALPVIYTDGHDLTENPKVEATCTENGMEAYWECGVCGKLFADADALMEIDAPVTIPGGHHLTTHEKQDATCTSDGTEAYWECDACGKLFADADAFIEIDEPEVIPGGHELLEYWQVAATCTKAGNTAYWACEACGKYFSDAEGTDEIEENSWVISALGHNLTGTAAKDATSTEAGNTAYWTCEACGKYFSDAQGDTEIEEGSWVIPPLGAPVLTVSDVGSSYDYNDVVELRADVTCPSASDEELLDRYPDARITASLITADGDTVSGFIVQSVSGLEASFRFPLGDDSMGPGYYKIRVETNVEGLAADSASFYYTAEKNDLPDPADCRVKLTLNTTIFGLNERFRLTARVTNTAGEPVQGIRVGFQVLDLNGDITDFYTGYSYLYNTTNGEGTCSITSTLSEEEIFPAGHYVARVFILDGDSSDSLPFEFVRADHSTHQYVKVEGTAPTCTDAGTETYWKCSVCCLLFSAQNENAQISAPATIPARGHTPVVDPAVAATVDSTGLTEGSHCSVCGAILKAQQVIPKIDDPAIAVIDAATFPDKAFLAWVSANADTNRDGKLTKTEIASVKSADLSAVRTVEKLDGIELFTALEALDVSDNKLTELDVSGLTELRTLKADNNKLTCLDLSGNTKLTALSCAGSAYTVKVKAGVIDLSAFKGFDVSRASAFGTGKVSGTTLTVLEPGDVTYTYDCGRNFKAVFTLKVTADPVDVTKVTTSKVKYAYTGKEIEPVLTVTATVDGREITLDEKQYEAEFKDNVKAGKATVKVTGTGFFKGSVETAFEITKVKLASATLKYTKTTYTGKALKPTATVKAKVGGKTVTLKSGTDYSLTYKNNTDAGKATVTVKGKGNFTGTLTKTFTITGAPITEAKVKNASLPYNGKAKTPILIVKAKVGTRTVTLKKSTDYTATYANNTNVGTATVTVKGRGNYSGTVKCTFKINPLKLSTGKAALSDTALKYTGKALKPKVTVTVKVGTKTVTLTQGTDFTVKYLNNKKPGTATVTITGKGNFTGTVKLTFDIMKK